MCDRRFQSVLIPLNARLGLAMSSELDDELETVAADNEDLEDDTL